MSLKLVKHIAVWMRVAGALAGATLAAQETTSTVHIYTNVPGAVFYIDGQQHSQSAVYNWPAGSKHIISTSPVQETLPGIAYVFKRWITKGQLPGSEIVMEPWPPTLTISADPSTPYVRMEFDVNYRMRLRYAPCDSGPCVSPGTIHVKCEYVESRDPDNPGRKVDHDAGYGSDADIWCRADSDVVLVAQPNPGYAFVGWLSQPTGTTNSFTQNFILTGPRDLFPKFGVARQVRLLTEPAELKLMADRMPVSTPIVMDWVHGSVHTLAPVSPQMDKWSKAWVFRSWSNNQPATHAYTVEAMNAPATVTATFVPGARFSLRTSPAGLKLRVDGRDDWPSGDFIWGVGETHRVEAPARLIDSQGRTCVFTGWSGGGDAAQEIAVADGHVALGVNMVANYETQAGVTLRSSEPGVTFTVDGAPCPGPCSLERRPGTEVRIAAPAEVVTGDGVRLEFVKWSDGAPRERSFTPTIDLQTLDAVYRIMLRLAAVADPPEAAGFRFDPPSPDGYYEARTSVNVTIEPRAGYRFRKWEGDLAGSLPYGAVRMMAPKAVRALFQSVPHVAEAGVVNAAGETPVAGVAPGSIVSIYGSGLAGETLAGPDSPLAQTLGGVTVRVEDRWLPLFFVSPNQINAQLPPDLEPGTRRVTVKREGEAEVQGSFEAVRHAPGLFQQIVEGRSWGALARPDGSAVAPGSPAKRGEIVTLYGTGFGPYDRTPPAGFPAPVSPPYRLVDPLTVVAGQSLWEPLEAFAAPGRTGIDAVRFRIPQDAPSGTIELKVRIAGVESNPVLLAVE